MRKFAFEVNANGKKYSHELRQAVANRVDFYLNTTPDSLNTIWHKVGKEFEISWGSVRNYHDALGNAASARGRTRNSVNISPIAKSRYPEKVRHLIMSVAMKPNRSIPEIADSLQMSNSTIYSWIKAYGWSTAYFNK